MRRHALTASGQINYRDGREETITIQYLLAVPETALALMGASVALLASEWLVARL